MAEEQTTKVGSLDDHDSKPKGNFDNIVQISGESATGTQQDLTQPTAVPGAEQPLAGTLHDMQFPPTGEEEDFSNLEADSLLCLLRARQDFESEGHNMYGSSEKHSVGSVDVERQAQLSLPDNVAILKENTAELSRRTATLRNVVLFSTVAGATLSCAARVWLQKSNASAHNDAPQTTTDINSLAASSIQLGSVQVDQTAAAVDDQELGFDTHNPAAVLKGGGQETCTTESEHLPEFVDALMKDAANGPSSALDSGSMDNSEGS